MGSLSSEEASDNQSGERCCGNYSLSADVSESESSSCFSCPRFAASTSIASTSIASSPLPSRLFAGDPAFPTLFPATSSKDVVVWDDDKPKFEMDVSEVDMMKERFAKLLLGEDMSGGGKGVCTALAISNAITNLSATVFGELWRLEPLAPQKKAIWHREMEYLLCVSDSIVELIPSRQLFPGGGTYEVMATRPRSDLYINLPALKKLDAMLISILDGFRDLEFCYVDRGIIVADRDDQDAYQSSVSGGRPSVRQEEKWWLPCPNVPPKGLSEAARKKLQQCRDCTNQILKAALAINSNVLAEMEIPSAYLDTLPKGESSGRNGKLSEINTPAISNSIEFPKVVLSNFATQIDPVDLILVNTMSNTVNCLKNGKACLGEIIYRYITADQFLPECLLDCLDLSSEHHTLKVANRIEAAVRVWMLKDQKTNHSKAKRSSWSGRVKGLVADGEKNHFLAKRAENLLNILRLRFPGLPQTALDMSKIQYNKDVGHSILESYSRVMESLAFNIMARIDDVLYVDDAAKYAAVESMSFFCRGGLDGLPIQKRILPSPFSVQHTPYTSPFATPTFCSSPPIVGSPSREPISVETNGLKLMPLLSYAGNLSGRKSGDAPERD